MAARVSGSSRAARPSADSGVRAGSAEHARLAGDAGKERGWRRWGPYVSERQWGTVREDYSADGRAWEYFSHDEARSRAYRWGEDGIAGVSDRDQRLCLALALWNSKDPILKERLFGLTNREGNHGEDVKEIYYYLDSTPTHSYMKMLYKYPQAEFPYARLVDENGRRGRGDPEFELANTGIFDEDRYFDVFVEYAKADKADLLMAVTLHNRGRDEAEIHLLPQLWFRNIWSWDTAAERPGFRLDPMAPFPCTTRSFPRISFIATASASFCSRTTTPTPACTTSSQTGSSRMRFTNMSAAAMRRRSIHGGSAPRPLHTIG